MNAEKEKELVKLIDEAARFCEVYLNYKPATVAGYRKAWFNILDFMTIYGLDSLDKKISSIIPNKVKLDIIRGILSTLSNVLIEC